MPSFQRRGPDGAARLGTTRTGEEQPRTYQHDNSSAGLRTGSQHSHQSPSTPPADTCVMPHCDAPPTAAVMVVLDGEPRGWLLCARHFSDLQRVLADGVVPWIEVASVRTVGAGA